MFSDLNNLQDISMWEPLCGRVRGERGGVAAGLQRDIRMLGEANGMSEEETLAKLRENYNGYHFCEDCIGVYNPLACSILLPKRFRSYWFETGTPTYLVELLKMHRYNLEDLAHEVTTADVLNSVDSASTNPVPVVYQSGYLTIKEYDPRFETYTLGFPNREVEEALQQINDKQYTLPFSADGRQVFKVGVNFSKETRNIERWLIEEQK